MMRVSIIGTGYVGLVTGVCLAAKGVKVVCVDQDIDKVATIMGGKSPIYEEGLDALLLSTLDRTFHATSDFKQAILDTDLTIISVGTPFKDGKINLDYIKTAARQIGEALCEKNGYHVVVVKSTVVPGTTDDVVLPILEEASGKKAGRDFGVGMNPEFLREGNAIHDFMSPDRIVLGGMDQTSQEFMARIYNNFTGIDILRTNCRTAEMIKYTANALLATLISFSNEIGNLCGVLPNVDVQDVMSGVYLDHRLSPIMENGKRVFPSILSYLAAGCGFGGSCFPKDLSAIHAFGKQLGLSMDMVGAAINTNLKQPMEMLRLLKKHFYSLDGISVTVLGLAFKPGTDDIRESPAISILEMLIEERAVVTAFDPVAADSMKRIFNSSIAYVDTLEKAIDGSDAILLMTHWDIFDKLPVLVAKQIKIPVVVDGRRKLEPNKFECYEGIGRYSTSVCDR
ncbi:MAG: UDP-glucose/GDP-mannose dehydrogenase family protein [Magnetococcus sp. YQC-5]